MQTISQQLEELEDKLKLYDVNDDEHQNWLEHKVTKRFLLEAQYAMMWAIDKDDHEGPPTDVGEIALRASYIKGMKEAFDMILEWQPENLLN